MRIHPTTLTGQNSFGALTGPTVFTRSKISNIEKVLGANFHGPDSWAKLGVNGVQLSDSDLVQYPRLTLEFLDAPFEYNPEIKRSEAGIFIVSAKGQSINSFHRLANEECLRTGRHPAFCDENLEQNERYANAAPKCHTIHFVLKDIVPNSVSKGFYEQKRLRKPGFCVAGARELAQAVGMQYMDSNERLYKNKLYGRTRNFDSDGHSVLVGYSLDDGSRVLSGLVRFRYDNVGITLAWNLRRLATLDSF